MPSIQPPAEGSEEATRREPRCDDHEGDATADDPPPPQENRGPRAPPRRRQTPWMREARRADPPSAGSGEPGSQDQTDDEPAEDGPVAKGEGEDEDERRSDTRDEGGAAADEGDHTADRCGRANRTTQDQGSLAHRIDPCRLTAKPGGPDRRGQVSMIRGSTCGGRSGSHRQVVRQASATAHRWLSCRSMAMASRAGGARRWKLSHLLLGTCT